MRIAAPPRRSRRLPMTALIDVVFILLFFFMLASSQVSWRNLPLSLGGKVRMADTQPGELWWLRVEADGTLRLNDHEVAPDLLIGKLRQHQGRLSVSAEPGVKLQQLVDVLDQVRATGVQVSVDKLPPP